MGTSSQSLTPSPRRDPALKKMPAASGSVSELVVGIAKDTERMVSRYVKLAKLDLRKEIDDAKRAMIGMAMAATILLVAGVLFALAACRALTYVTGLPLAVSYAIGGGLLVVIGLVWITRDRSEAFDVTPPALEEAKEDVKWMKEHS